jgi:hypothetical protein
MPTRAIRKLFTLRKRGKGRGARVGAGKGMPPQYRRDDRAVEYGTERARQENAPIADEPHPTQEKAGSDVGFRPLPRCPGCGTAMGFDQRECHSCGREQKKV